MITNLEITLEEMQQQAEMRGLIKGRAEGRAEGEARGKVVYTVHVIRTCYNGKLSKLSKFNIIRDIYERRVILNVVFQNIF
ncbi:hypothetical protein GFC01_15960 [Desulfofundulus thermobenzoicus]|uniref:Uncharacterized protein n=1 Tax=Desulfofundulus thermobenzoicus TaxID=29376 RepID=A0A6N7IW73_9FIRM|nr:hypothetical protein [Desulfofundulus thermobenzoicus]MQL53727.1 hypothetical protein [Desulfofundulus thermobenzoicus]HHW44104.1 hypothetical protein [Desulfotomaculum sp.]